MSYTKVAQLGAGGNIGAPILDALVSSNKFELTVVARKQSSVQVPSSVKLVKVDYDNHAELVDALRGQEAIVITLGDLATLEKNSKAIIDAAIEAGVKRVIPSEFGNDLGRAPGSTRPVFSAKLNVIKYLAERESQIEYTEIATGAFFDWGLRVKFLGFDIPGRKAKIYGDGTRKINTTTLDSIAQSVVGVLSSPAQFKNKYIRVHDFYVSQNEIKAALESITGSPFEVETVNVEELEEATSAGLARGEYTHENIYGLILAYIYGKNSSASWGEEDESVAVGLAKKDLRAEIQKKSIQ
jgi:uncharacterized protein YbjT (DUF2867 family)